MRILFEQFINRTKHYSHSQSPIPFGPFNTSTQKRWKKPSNTAQTRLENRTRDPTFDNLMTHLHKLTLILNLHTLITTKKRAPFLSVQLMSRWTHLVGINVPIGSFLRKYPHVFEVFTHPVKRNLCCKFSVKFMGLIEEEVGIVQTLELDHVMKIKRLLMMSVSGTLHVHALRLIRRELGLPENFRELILSKYNNEFKLVDLEIVALVNRDDDENLGFAGEVEKWREKEYREKWLSEFETKYAFPINFPTGFRIEPGFREKLRNWQRLPYVKPYEKMEVVRVRTCGGIERFEKRAVGILHELLSLTVEKMVEVERLAHFRKDLGIEVNIRELLLKHPGIFYISTKGSTRMVFLREAYCKGCLVEPNPTFVVRRKMLDLVLLGCRNTRELRKKEVKEETKHEIQWNENIGGRRDGDFVIPLLQSFNDQNNDGDHSEIGDLSEADYENEISPSERC